MLRRPPRSTLSSSSAASDVYKRQCLPVAGGSPCDRALREEQRDHRWQDPGGGTDLEGHRHGLLRRLGSTRRRSRDLVAPRGLRAQIGLGRTIRTRCRDAARTLLKGPESNKAPRVTRRDRGVVPASGRPSAPKLLAADTWLTTPLLPDDYLSLVNPCLLYTSPSPRDS